MPASSQLWLYLVALVSGGAGGAAGAGWHAMGGKAVTRSLLLSYLVVGAVVGIFVDAWLLIYAAMNKADLAGAVIHHLIALGTGSGFMAVTGLVFLRKLATVALKYKGLSVELKFHREGSDTCNKGGS